MKKIGLASDHAGYPLKEQVKEWLKDLGYEFVDFGTNSTESCNYPEFAHALAEELSKVSGKNIHELLCMNVTELLDFFENMQAYKEAKLKLFSRVAIISSSSTLKR